MIILPMPIYTPHYTDGGSYTPSIMLCVVSTLISVVASGLFLGVAYFAYIVFKEQEYVPGFLLVVADFLFLALAIICFSGAVVSYKDLKKFAKENRKDVEKEISIDNYVNSLFKKEKQNERK